MSQLVKSFLVTLVIVYGFNIMPIADLTRILILISGTGALCLITSYIRRTECKECNVVSWFTPWRHCMKCNGIYCGMHAKTKLIDYIIDPVPISEHTIATGPTGPVGKCCRNECKLN